MTDTTQGELWPQLDISVRPWQQPQTPGDAGQALTNGHGDMLSRYADAIAKIESAGSGGYSAQGPQTRSGDRAYGRYQVMGANIPEWTREALGHSLTPEEFLASPEAQDAVFRHKFGSYVAQYGNPADAASAWLTGRPLASGANAKDQLGTSGAAYAQKFFDNLGVGAEGGAPLSGNLLAQTPQVKQAGVVDQLLGLNGQERYQLWPERMAREALAAPHQALTQGFVPGSPDEIAAANAISNFAGGGSIPFAARGAVGALGGRLTQVRGPAEAAAGATAPVFYSTAAQTLENAGFNEASPAQWLAYLRNAQGVKGEELDWTGLADRLGNASEPQLTKAELLQHLADNQIELNEVPKGGTEQTPSLLDVARGAPVPQTTWGPTKYGSYTLPGAEPGSYREALLQLPQKPANTTGWRAELDPEGNYGDYKVYDQTGNLIAYRNATSPEDAIRRATKDISTGQPRDAYRSSHWDEPNVLGHVRMNDRQVTVQGVERPLDALFLEELQSDWHQQGRRAGYGNKSATEGSFSNPIGSVPNAPFKTTWPELLLKRMIREAAESGKDALAWTSGETQAARYDLSKQVEKLEISRGQNGKYEIYGTPKGERYPVKLGDAVPEEKLADYVGKDLANKAVEDLKGDRPAGRVYSGLDLRVGGEGMLKFYDDMLPKVAQKIVKKYGGKVELGQAGDVGGARQKYEGPEPTTEELHKFIQATAQPPHNQQYINPITGNRERFVLNRVAVWHPMKQVNHLMSEGKTFSEAMSEVGTPELAELFRGKMGEERENKSVPVHVLRLTPELRKAALSQGFPLFQAGVPLSIAAPNGRVHTLTPVSHDPFADQQILKGNAT